MRKNLRLTTAQIRDIAKKLVDKNGILTNIQIFQKTGKRNTEMIAMNIEITGFSSIITNVK